MTDGVLLINMPFSAANRPQLALGLLQGGLRRRGITCDVAYLNLLFAAQLGARPYAWFSEERSDLAFCGDWVFAHPFFGQDVLDGDAYLTHLRQTLEADETTINLILKVRSLVPAYLEHCLSIIDWDRYSIIGFTSTFEQTMASLAFAYAIKERFPQKAIVLGGGNCTHPMGEALMRSFPFVDYCFTGEADETFPTFVERLLAHERIDDLPGVAYREGTRTKSTGLPVAVTDMEALPYPDYQDYFTQLDLVGCDSKETLSIPFETARGCWWGAKQHCTFCGLNALTMTFRSKSKDRALAEILHLAARYPVRELNAADNIIDMKYFRDLLPELNRHDLNLKIFYETKSNLTRDQVRLLKEAGITTIQPGIESLSDRLLKLLRKGVSPLQNIQLLKWCKEFGIYPSWNLLYGIPGERPSDYEQMLPLLQSLTHLAAPTSWGTIRLDRYSPYFQSPESFGLSNVGPARAYRHIYPIAETELRDIAYYYEFAFADGYNPNEHIAPILQHLNDWEAAEEAGADLRKQIGAEEELLIEDCRPNAICARTTLTGWQRRVYDYCEQVRSLQALERLLGQEVSKTELYGFLESLVQFRLMARDQDQFLSLAVSNQQTA